MCEEAISDSGFVISSLRRKCLRKKLGKINTMLMKIKDRQFTLFRFTFLCNLMPVIPFIKIVILTHADSLLKWIQKRSAKQRTRRLDGAIRMINAVGGHVSAMIRYSLAGSEHG